MNNFIEMADSELSDISGGGILLGVGGFCVGALVGIGGATLAGADFKGCIEAGLATGLFVGGIGALATEP
jgi:hypothetical protein